MPVLAVAAVAAGAAVATGVVAASTVAMVGLATSVVGRVTKSKELMQIGSGMSVGAGIASIATSVFGGAEAAAGVAESAGTAGASAGSAAESVAGVSEAAGSLEGAASAIESAAEAGSAASAASGGLTSGLGEAATVGTGLLSSTPQASQALSSTPQASMSPGVEGIGGTSFGSGASVVPPPATDSFSIAKWWAGQSEATKNRILQVGGQAAGGLFEGWSQEQKLAFERERQNLLRDQYNTSKSNANAQPVVAFKPTPSYSGGLLTPQRG